MLDPPRLSKLGNFVANYQLINEFFDLGCKEKISQILAQVKIAEGVRQIRL